MFPRRGARSLTRVVACGASVDRSSRSFLQVDPLVDLDALEDIDAATDPAHFNLINVLVLAQSEVKACAVVALITTTAVDFVDLHQLARDHFDPRSDAVPIGPPAQELELDPMSIARRVIPQHGGLREC